MIMNFEKKWKCFIIFEGAILDVNVEAGIFQNILLSSKWYLLFKVMFSFSNTTSTISFDNPMDKFNHMLIFFSTNKSMFSLFFIVWKPFFFWKIMNILILEISWKTLNIKSCYISMFDVDEIFGKWWTCSKSRNMFKLFYSQTFTLT